MCQLKGELEHCVPCVVLCLCVLMCLSHGQMDTSVCTVGGDAGQGIQPLPAIPPSYAAEIKWTSQSDHWMYYVREDFDPSRQQSVMRISLPLLSKDAKVIYDLTHGYISIFGDGTNQACQVHQPDGTYYMFNDLIWLASLSQMTRHVEGGMDVKYEGVTQLDGVLVSHYSACLFEYQINSTAFYNIYYIDNSKPLKTNWVLPHITGREPFSIFPYYITIDVKGPKFTGKVQGQISRFDINPDFKDEIFLPPPGTWCEGLPLTSLPAFPTQFSTMSEVVDLDFHKVSYEWLWFDSESRFVRWDWKDVDNSQGSNNPDPFSYIYDYNIGIKYSIDRNLQTCSRPSLISLADDYSAPTSKDHGPFGRQFAMAGSEVFFHNKGFSHQKIGRQTVRGVPCDVYVGLYLDDVLRRNFTIQWYFSAQGWSINSDQVLTVGALYKMDIWRGASTNPIVRNILEYTPVAPPHDVFDASMCYSAAQKIHFVMMVTVTDAKLFAQVTRRVLRELLLSVLDQFIVENNRFAPLEMDYDGNQTLYVYTSLLERVPLDNPDIVHIPQHNMEAAFSFLEGSIRAHQSFLVRNIDNQPVTLVPQEIYRLKFKQDFTTNPPPLPTTTPILIAPSKKHSTTTVTAPSTTATTQKTMKLSTPPTPPTNCNCPTTFTSQSKSCPKITCAPNTNPCHCPSQSSSNVIKPSWLSCRSLCISNNYCPCPASNQHTNNCPPCGKTTCNCEQKCTPVRTGSSHGDSDATTFSIGSLVGSMIGFLIMGLALGFVLTRIYHVKRLMSPTPLFQKAEDF